MMKSLQKAEETEIKVVDPIKLVRFPDSGVAEATPPRPFPEPARVIDMTIDAPYEKQWMPL